MKRESDADLNSGATDRTDSNVHWLHQSLGNGSVAPAKSYRWRKTTDVNREFAIFELLDDEKIVLDVGFSDAGIFEIGFNREIAGALIEWEKLQKMIEEGKRFAELDK
jgi:hypothetical protein